MTQILSASSEIASWDWYVEIENGKVLDSASAMTLSISRALDQKALMELAGIQISWHRHGQGSIGFRSRVSLCDLQRLNEEFITERITESQPVGHTDTHVGQIELLGSGYWINADGKKKRVNRLVDVSILLDPDDISVALGVRHDIWMWFDFSGKPHPKVYYNNKTRLSEALKEIEGILGTDTIPGDPTYFAEPEKYGIVTPEANSEGFSYNEVIPASLR